MLDKFNDGGTRHLDKNGRKPDENAPRKPQPQAPKPGGSTAAKDKEVKANDR